MSLMGLGTKNDCAGEGPDQTAFSIHSDSTWQLITREYKATILYYK
jgi:hypothetical protein